jgi:hypothetical protein
LTFAVPVTILLSGQRETPTNPASLESTMLALILLVIATLLLAHALAQPEPYTKPFASPMEAAYVLKRAGMRATKRPYAVAFAMVRRLQRQGIERALCYQAALLMGLPWTPAQFGRFADDLYRAR